jgi:hypothetical protein
MNAKHTGKQWTVQNCVQNEAEPAPASRKIALDHDRAGAACRRQHASNESSPTCQSCPCAHAHLYCWTSETPGNLPAALVVKYQRVLCDTLLVSSDDRYMQPACCQLWCPASGGHANPPAALVGLLQSTPAELWGQPALLLWLRLAIGERSVAAPRAGLCSRDIFRLTVAGALPVGVQGGPAPCPGRLCRHLLQALAMIPASSCVPWVKCSCSSICGRGACA